MALDWLAAGCVPDSKPSRGSNGATLQLPRSSDVSRRKRAQLQDLRATGRSQLAVELWRSARGYSLKCSAPCSERGGGGRGVRPAAAMPEMNAMASPRSPREPCTPSLAVNRHPCEIRFQNLSYHVPHKGEGGLPILNGVTGLCRASKMVAVMGPSGAGKSTLVRLA